VLAMLRVVADARGTSRGERREETVVLAREVGSGRGLLQTWTKCRAVEYLRSFDVLEYASSQTRSGCESCSRPRRVNRSISWNRRYVAEVDC